jgi:hypothetical protein
MTATQRKGRGKSPSNRNRGAFAYNDSQNTPLRSKFWRKSKERHGYKRPDNPSFPTQTPRSLHRLRQTGRSFYPQAQSRLSLAAAAAASPSTSKFSTRSGTSSSSSSAAPPVFNGRCWPCWIAWYDSASLRSEARESGPSWFRMPGTSSVSSFTCPVP